MAVAPRHVSLTAFFVSQVVIDQESGYQLLLGDWPVLCLATGLVGIVVLVLWVRKRGKS